MFVKTAWRTIVGIGALALAALQGLRAALSWGGEVDLIITRAADPGWIGVVFDQLINPPPYLILPLIAMGLGLIYWDMRRRATALPTGPSLPLREPLPAWQGEVGRAGASEWLTKAADAVVWPTERPPEVKTAGGRDIDAYLNVWDRSTGGRACLAVRKEKGKTAVIVVQRVPKFRDTPIDMTFPLSRAVDATRQFLQLVANQSSPSTTDPRRTSQ